MFSFLYTCVHVFHVQKLWFARRISWHFLQFQKLRFASHICLHVFCLLEIRKLHVCFSLFFKKVNPKKLHFCSPWKMQNHKVTFLGFPFFPQKRCKLKKLRFVFCRVWFYIFECYFSHIFIFFYYLIEYRLWLFGAFQVYASEEASCQPYGKEVHRIKSIGIQTYNLYTNCASQYLFDTGCLISGKSMSSASFGGDGVSCIACMKVASDRTCPTWLTEIALECK